MLKLTKRTLRLIVSYGSIRIREICENHAAASNKFSDANARLLRAALSDILAANHAGEVIGLSLTNMGSQYMIQNEGILRVGKEFILKCTLLSTLSESLNEFVPQETIRRIRIDEVDGYK